MCDQSLMHFLKITIPVREKFRNLPKTSLTRLWKCLQEFPIAAWTPMKKRDKCSIGRKKVPKDPSPWLDWFSETREVVVADGLWLSFIGLNWTSFSWYAARINSLALSTCLALKRLYRYGVFPKYLIYSQSS